ncbi:RHOMBOID-like protein 9, chloroplastic isoform X2 [Malania oleifera]|uniref:RHOMBOID-like protein 9, chloroplastic isoform X2 n=1 Tax=Malania oleifera TaxID=397392 RepID=UPI0025AE4852|nr:RHOMBOID-like protein 9, chloroplastic isoform X2 [Malania oleifera]
MAATSLCFRMSYDKDQTHSNMPTKIRQKKRGFISQLCSNANLQGDVSSRCLLSVSSRDPGWSTAFQIMSGLPFPHRVVGAQGHPIRPTSEAASQSPTQVLCMLRSARRKPNPNEKQLRSLDSYFEKLQNEADQASSDSLSKTPVEFHSRGGQFKSNMDLGSLDHSLEKTNADAEPENYALSSLEEEIIDDCNPAEVPFSVSDDSKRANVGVLKSQMKLRNKNGERAENSEDQQAYDDPSEFYLIVLAAINIAVCIFEMASPVRSSDLELLSIPLIYGAKINELILVGEWWRLLTPMFLHSGVFHVTLGSWVLLTFGPKVCKGYGLFTFYLIYILGGISGNLTSFFHTPDPTVGGTGPTFAVIGAWLIYQIQNKDVIAKDVSESLFQKAMIATAASFILSHFGPIDDWAHVGAAFTGVAYGFFTCPALQMDKASSKTGQQEGTLGQANPCKSLTIFALFILAFSSLVFLQEPPLITIVSNNFEFK